MFTGIVECQGEVRTVRMGKDGVRVSVRKPSAWKLPVGASIAVDGICVSAERSGVSEFSFFLMPETLARTTAGTFSARRPVNLERPLSAGDPLGGHIVQGHVDARGSVGGVRDAGGSRVIFLKIPRELRRFVAGKGSIAVNGVSLTVARKTGDGCVVALTPLTRASTNLGALAVGDEVNIEVDVVARYLDALRKRG